MSSFSEDVVEQASIEILQDLPEPRPGQGWRR